MALSLNEIRARAAAFAQAHQRDDNEEAESQEFLIDFLNVFGITRRKVASFEHRVRCSDDKDGYIDLFWKGMILIEMKSDGKDLEAGYQQARRYADALPQHELPHIMMVCDFKHWHVYDLDHDNARTEFTLDQFANHIELFIFMAGYQKRVYHEQDPVNLRAAELMGKVHDRLRKSGYTGHALEVFLVRLLFCMFADDTSTFGKDDFLFYLKERTAEDGSDLGAKLDEFFSVLNQSPESRLSLLDEQLAEFPYINGKLFEERLPNTAFDSGMRRALIECCELDWGQISPAIFGAMFQSVMNPVERRNLGAHYTSEQNILKLIHPLFLDDLWAEFHRIQVSRIGKKQRLQQFHEKIASLKFLDPACGCGNFLVITYRELRLLEIAILEEQVKLNKSERIQRVLDVQHLCLLNVDQFYGIEIEEFPAQIAKVALWLMDHQMNPKVRDTFGQYFVRIPLRTSPTILCANALRTDWEKLIPKTELSYILGNPPFVGRRYRSPEQIWEISQIFPKARNLDYVACWYKKAADYIKNTTIKVAFVSTNSISQGEQVALLWRSLTKSHIDIFFAHQTFRWNNEAKENAAVYCVIIGFSSSPSENCSKRLFTYKTPLSSPEEISVTRLNPYLVDAVNLFVAARTDPLCQVPPMVNGNVPLDGDQLKIEPEDYESFKDCKYLKRLVGGRELLYNEKRWVLWLVDASPDELRKMPNVMERIVACRNARLNMKDLATQKLANTPTTFRDTNNPSHYIALPMVSSESRVYIPMAYLDGDYIPTNQIQTIPNATLYHFGVLTSEMHMAWTRYVCGRLEMRYRYSKDIVYNNFPWPEANETERMAIEQAAQAVLDSTRGPRSRRPVWPICTIPIPCQLCCSKHIKNWIDWSNERITNVSKPTPNVWRSSSNGIRN